MHKHNAHDVELTTWYGFFLNLHAYTVYMNLPHSIEKSCWFQLGSPSFTTQNQLVQLSEENLQDPTLGCPDLRTTTKPPRRVWLRRPQRPHASVHGTAPHSQRICSPETWRWGPQWAGFSRLPDAIIGGLPQHFSETQPHMTHMTLEKKIFGC